MRLCSLIAFAGGVLAGGLVMMMVAPKKGEEMRQDIKDRMNNLKKHIGDAIDGCKDKCCCEVEEKMTVKE